MDGDEVAEEVDGSRQPPELSRGSRRMTAERPATAPGERPQASTCFLQRMADASERHWAAQQKSLSGESLPSSDVGHCTFAPKINEAAHARRRAADGRRRRARSHPSARRCL